MERLEKGSLPPVQGPHGREPEDRSPHGREPEGQEPDGGETRDRVGSAQGAADRIIAALEGGGENRGEGQFTLDLAVALEKVGRFALPTPEDVPLMLVRAAVLRGARRIHVKADADDLWVECDGSPLREGSLRQLFDALLGERSGAGEAGMRELAVAVATAQQQSLRFLVVESGGAEIGARLRLRPGKPPVIEKAPSGIHGTRVQWRRAFGAEVVERQSAHAVGRLPETMAILDRCRYCPVEIWLQGKAIPRDVDGAELVGTTQIQEPGLRALVGYQTELSEAPSVRVVRDGVWIDTISLPTGKPGLLAVVEAAALRTDLTGSKVVRDAAWEALVHRLQEVAAEIPQRLALTLASDEERRRLRRRPLAEHLVQRAVMEELGDRDARSVDPESPLGRLVRAPVWQRLNPHAPGWLLLCTAELKESLAEAAGITVLQVRRGMALPRLHPRVLLIHPGTLMIALRDAEVASWLTTLAPGDCRVLSPEEVEDWESRYPPPLSLTGAGSRLWWRYLGIGWAVAAIVAMLIVALVGDCE